MLSFLLSILGHNLAGGGGGGPFVLTSANLTNNQLGTSCGDPLKVNVSPVYTGSASGITLTLEQSWDRGAYTTVASGLDPITAFPYVLSMDGYYNKFGVSVPLQVRLTDEGDGTNTVTSSQYTTTYTLCGA